MQSTVTLYPGDNRLSLQKLIDQGVRVHAVVTDPPYGLVSIEKRFGKKGAVAARTEGNDGSFARLSAGFMGRTWDGTGIERDPEFWRLIHDILLPGGFCFAFSGARTGHWQACAMEAAGFIMHPFHVWAYGSGFPKAKDVEKELVKAGFTDEELLAEWSGWKFGTQSQKPAVEPIYLAQRPISEKTYIANIKKHGVGAVNIDGCRVPLDSVADAKQLRTMNRNRREEDTSGQSWGLSKNAGAVAQVVDENGRYPANLFHDNSPEVLDLFPKDAGSTRVEKVNSVKSEVDLTAQPEIAYPASTARFFNAFPSDECPALLYHPKANKEDRGGSEHPTVKPVGLLRHLIRHITPPGGVVLDPFAGSGTTAIAARAEGVDCIIMEAEGEYIDFLQERFGRSLNVDGTGVDANTTDLSDLFLTNATTNDELLV
ncbi:DNA methylase [Rhodobacter phage RcWhiteOak]|nr:DNA methylase [Rhodobacter phage RcWhiteOak]